LLYENNLAPGQVKGKNRLPLIYLMFLAEKTKRQVPIQREEKENAP